MDSVLAPYCINKNNYGNGRIPFAGNRLLAIPIHGIKPRSFWEAVTCKPHREGLLDCFFTEMTSQDIGLAQKSMNLFEYSEYGKKIIQGFLYKQRPNKFNPPGSYLLGDNRTIASHFYMLEPKKSSSPEKIKGLAWVEERKGDVLYIGYLQALKSSSNQVKQGRGEGSALMYGILRLAQKLQKRRVSLMPSELASSWYDRLGFKYIWDNNEFAYSLTSKDLDPALQHLEKRLNISRPDFLMRSNGGDLC